MPLLRSLVKPYLAWLEVLYAADTVQVRRNNLKHFCTWCS